MSRRIPASRAILTAALVLATAQFASAAEVATETTTTTETTTVKAKPFKPTIYVGPTFGYANQDGHSRFGWGAHALMRPLENLAIQIEYFNLGHNIGGKGDVDGGYFGLAPMFRVGNRVDLYGQIGLAVSAAGEDVAGGGGVMYALPIAFFIEHNVDIELVADYKYINIADGNHLLTFGLLFGLHK
jgi:hypothetical protein